MKLTPIELKEKLQSMSLNEIAIEVKLNWAKVYFGAVPYLDALRSMDKISDKFGADDGKSIVAYFLGNAQTFRGEEARLIKAELNRRLKVK